MRAQRIMFLGALALIWIGFSGTSHAQYALGSVSSVTQETCPTALGGHAADWVTTTNNGTVLAVVCYHAEVSCPETADLGFTYGLATPSAASNGMMVFVPSKFGTFTLPGNYKGEIPYDMYHSNYQTIQLAYDNWWQLTGTTTGSLKVASCRIATVLNFFYTTYFLPNNNTTTAGMCAHSQSGGAGGLGFAMTYYGVGDFLDKAAFVSGPEYGNLVEGCVPPVHPAANICPSTNGVYAMGCSTSAGTWSDAPNYLGGSASNISTELNNDPPCSKSGFKYTKAEQQLLADTSVVDGLSDASYTYPNTAVTAFLCDDDSFWTNPSETQGWYYYSQFNTSSVPSTCNYTGNNSSTPNSCLMVNRVFGCTTVEEADTGYLCNGSTCPVCTGTPPNIKCTCGGKTCSTQGTPSFAMHPFAEADYESPVNGCINRHGARLPVVK
ncbi:MAG TPA: hypothetical protein VND65_00975 [Candidatus Binatia bacterium]|nr:hypothetical protein [Candidatus Binatia bacterium]